jgi:hypothetical protein
VSRQRDAEEAKADADGATGDPEERPGRAKSQALNGISDRASERRLGGAYLIGEPSLDAVQQHDGHA